MNRAKTVYWHLDSNGGAKKRLVGDFPCSPERCDHHRLGEKTWMSSTRPWRTWESYTQFCLDCGINCGGFLLDRRR
jgi:hypothetical protein